ncbi:Sulfotransferase domain protein [Jannaschia seosinensis]|uniref:Sulfotransferase domain protein n=1 Tax=Jannaschia seosinensis TaxID=313367 RepID=A0A0M7B7N9_9RHOB|nr:sulfotransferase domain-containing protein [Jannaschia seosinensis]CUH20650.1 Sulfotransferase domain protein [Jannaschia seosinensis]
MTLPDFLIIGAMKCGTTTLASQLAAQDGLFLTDPKEPNFFSDDDQWNRGLDWYRNLFAEAPEGALKGEASTHYTKGSTHPKTLERMRPVLSAPRLVYMIRDPVARAMSHFVHEWSQGVLSHDIDAAFENHPPLVDYGLYAKQIAPFIDAYGSDAVLLTSLEQVKADPQGELTRIAAHVGYEGNVIWHQDLGAQNVSAERVRRLPMQSLLVENPVAEVLRRTLVPKPVRTWIRNRRRMKTRPELPKDQRVRMQEVFLEDRARLAQLFPDHLALNFCYPFAT